MNDPKAELTEALGSFFTNRQTIALQTAKVTAIETSEQTATVEDMEGLALYDVKLRPTLDGDDSGLLLVPSVGSYVVIGQVGQNDWVVLLTTEVSSVSAKIGGSEMEVTQSGFTFKNGITRFELDNAGLLIERAGQSLNSVLESLIAQIQLITVTCAAPGAPSTPPLNTAAFEVVKTQIYALLK